MKSSRLRCRDRCSSLPQPPAVASSLAIVLTVIMMMCMIQLFSFRGVDANAIDVFYSNGLSSRSFLNASYGLEHLDEYWHQCTSSGKPRSMPFKRKEDSMGYTPNRRLQNDSLAEGLQQKLQLAVVLALGGHNNGRYDYGKAGSLNGLMAVWDSWVEFFFSMTSNTTSLILLLDERDFLNQNVTKSSSEYMDILLVKNMGAQRADCAYLNPRGGAAAWGGGGMRGRLHVAGVFPGGGGGVATAGGGTGNRKTHRPPPYGCDYKLAVDKGYQVYYLDVTSHANNLKQQPLIVFVAVHKFPKPDWAKDQDEETLYIHWRPGRLNRRYPTNYGYVKMTNWYAYHMLNLQLLDYFDYAAKLDNDVSFVSPFPQPNLPLFLASKETKMMTTQTAWYNDDGRITQGTRQCLESYVDEESKRCVKGDDTSPTKKKTGKKEVLWLKPGAEGTALWEGNLNLTMRAHFLVFWLGLYAAPETKAMAKYWNDWHPKGMWDYRWGDQQWWPRPIAMYGTGNIGLDFYAYEEINTDNEKYVVHKLWPRFGTIKGTDYFNFSGTTRWERDAMYNLSASKQSKYRPF